MPRTMLAILAMLTACSLDGDVYLTTSGGDDEQQLPAEETGESTTTGGPGATSLEQSSSTSTSGDGADSSSSTSDGTTGAPCDEPVDPLSCVLAFDATGVQHCYCDGHAMCTLDPCEADTGDSGSSTTGCMPHLEHVQDAWACLCGGEMLDPMECGCPPAADDCTCAGDPCGPCGLVGAVCVCGNFLAPPGACEE